MISALLLAAFLTNAQPDVIVTPFGDYIYLVYTREYGDGTEFPEVYEI